MLTWGLPANAPVSDFPAIMPAPGNRLLSLLPPDSVARLRPHLELVDLQRKDVLFRAHEPLHAVYFPVSAVISLIITLDSGAAMEADLVGRDGLVGITVAPGVATMPCEAVVQIAGTAYRMDAERLRRQLVADESLHAAVGAYVLSLLARSMQMLLCNRFHSVEQRCIRRLLQVSDLIDSPDLSLTHEAIAAALGVRRPTVTLVLRSLQHAGFIEEKRGRVTLRNRAALEAACCECYRAIRAQNQGAVLV